MPAINKRTLITVAAYAALFLVCFLIFAQRTFPYDRLRDLLVARVASASSPGSPTKLTIAELEPDWFTGVTFSDVQYERAPTTADEAPTRLVVDELTVHAQLLRFLFGGVGVDFDADVGGGAIDGTYSAPRQGPFQVESSLSDVDIARLGLGSLLGVPMRGTAEGTVDVQLSDKPAETNGTVELLIKQLKLGDGKAKVKIPGMPGGLTLDAIDAGNTEIKLKIREGVATVEKLEAKGKDIELTGSGSLRLARAITQSRIDLNIEVKFDKGYTQRSERTKIAFELMESSPVIKRATNADGAMRFRVSGTIAAPRSTPAGGAKGS